MALHVSDDILVDWQAQVDSGHQPSVVMRLAPAIPVHDAMRAVEETYRELIHGLSTDERPFHGEWSWVRAEDDVVITVREWESLPELLPKVAALLERKGVTGTLRVRADGPEPPPWPRPLRFVEARLRVSGRRRHTRGRSWKWRPDGAAFAATRDVALRWCLEAAGATTWLELDANPVVAVRRDDLIARMREEEGKIMFAQVRAPTRGVVVDPLEGRVSLIDADESWERALEGIREVLREAAPGLVFALVKSGANPGYVLSGDELSLDWPPRVDTDPDRVYSTAAFEEELLPDAFPVLLLGPGYAGRIPGTRLYRAERIGDRRLLEHVDLPAWFGELLVPAETPFQKAREVTPPAVLAAAREALAPILLQPEAFDPPEAGGATDQT